MKSSLPMHSPEPRPQGVGDEQFHLLVDAVKDYAIFMLDPSGIVMSWNTGARRIKGYDEAEIVGRHFSAFYTAEDVAAGVPERGLKAAVTEGKYRAEGWRVRKNGTRFFADVLVTPVYKGEKLFGFAKVTRDVTERHRLEQQLRDRVDQLAEADRRKDEFLAMLAHELRNPLAPILTGIKIVQRVASMPHVGERALETMERQLKLMTRLVDDLVEIARITHGKIHLKRETVGLDDVLAHVGELVIPVLHARGQHLRTDIEPGIRIHCDAHRLVQAIANLLNNASKYSADGADIFLCARRHDGSACVTVRDTGIGIRPEMLETIFELFMQDQSPQGTRMQSGLGVGLSLVRTIVAMHGGRVWASSEGAGKGAAFHVEMPLLNAPEHEEPKPPVQPQFRILVVDDNRDAADMISDLLELEGYAVQKAYGGVEALRKADEMHPHLILLDLLMPDITGYEVIRRVRRNPGGPVVVAVTGHGSEADREAARRAGFDEHIVKPVVGDSILAVVRRFLKGVSFAPATLPPRA